MTPELGLATDLSPTIAELREMWFEAICPDPQNHPEAECPAALAFDAWFADTLASTYDRGYSDGFDARG